MLADRKVVGLVSFVPSLGPETVGAEENWYVAFWG
jgi:hypothetical protein